MFVKEIELKIKLEEEKNGSKAAGLSSILMPVKECLTRAFLLSFQSSKQSSLLPEVKKKTLPLYFLSAKGKKSTLVD